MRRFTVKRTLTTFLVIIFIVTAFSVPTFASTQSLFEDVPHYRYEIWNIDGLGGGYIDSTTYSYMRLVFQHAYTLERCDLIKTERIAFDPEGYDSVWKYTYEYFYYTW